MKKLPSIREIIVGSTVYAGAGFVLLSLLAATPLKDHYLQSDLNAAGKQITGLGTPTNASNAVTLSWATNNLLSTNVSYTNPAWLTSLAWSKLSSTPTTVSGYGITNAATLVNGLIPTNQLPLTVKLSPGPGGMSASSPYQAAAGIYAPQIDIFAGSNQNYDFAFDPFDRIWTSAFDTPTIRILSKNGQLLHTFEPPDSAWRQFGIHDAFWSMWQANYTAGTITRLNYDFTVAAVIPVGTAPVRIFSDQKFLYGVVSYNPGDSTNGSMGGQQSKLVKIDPADNTVVGEINVGLGAYGGAWLGGKWAVVTNSASGTLSLIDLDSFTVSATWPTGVNPMDVSIMNGVIGVACYNGGGTGYIRLHDARTGAVIGQFEGATVFNSSGVSVGSKGYPYSLDNDGTHWIPIWFRSDTLNVSRHTASGDWIDQFWIGSNHGRRVRYDGRDVWMARAGAAGAMVRMSFPAAPNFQPAGLQYCRPTGSTETFDFRFGDSIRLDLSLASGDLEPSFLNPVAGRSYTILVKQGATPRALILPAGTVLANGSTDPWTSPASSTRLLKLYFDGALWRGVNLSEDDLAGFEASLAALEDSFDDALVAKQDALTAGDGIEIEDGVISASGGGGGFTAATQEEVENGTRSDVGVTPGALRGADLTLGQLTVTSLIITGDTPWSFGTSSAASAAAINLAALKGNIIQVTGTTAVTSFTGLATMVGATFTFWSADPTGVEITHGNNIFCAGDSNITISGDESATVRVVSPTKVLVSKP